MRRRHALGAALAFGLAAACRAPEPTAPAGQAVAVHSPAPPPERPLPLVPGATIAATLKKGELHRYRLDLPLERFAALVVEQQGVDVVLRITPPDGHPLPEVDSHNGVWGPEPLPLLGAERPLGLEVRAAEAPPTGGRYVLRVGDVRAATARDRARVAAEQGFAASEGLRRRAEGSDASSLRAAAAGAREAAARFLALGERGRAADALYALGKETDLLGEPRASLSALRRALALFRAGGDRRSEGRTLNSLAPVHLALGSPRESLECSLGALALSRSLEQPLGEATALNNLGKARAAIGRSGEALADYEQALVLWRRLGDRRNEGKTRLNRARLLAGLGDGERALADLDRSLPLLAGRDVAAALGERGFLRARAGRTREAAADLARSLELYRQAGDRRGEAMALNDLGLLRLSLGRKGGAAGAFEEVVAAFHALGDSANEAAALVNLGRVQVEAGELFAAAEAAFHRYLSAFVAAGQPLGEANARMGMAQVSRARGDLRAALRDAGTSLDRLETLRSAPASRELRTSFFAPYQDAFVFTLDTTMELHRREPGAGYAARALEVAERARARSLLDALTQAGSGPRRAPPATVSRPLTVGEIRRRALAPDVLLLEYALGERRSFLWAVSRRALHSFELPPRRVLEEAARRAHGLLAESRRTLVRPQAQAALRELSRLLLAPAARELASPRIVVVPDGALHLVPFGALPDPAAPDFPLLARAAVVSAPSASSLAAIRTGAARRRPAPGVVAVLADPVFDRDDPRVTRREGPAAAPAATARRFPRLALSREEARQVVSLAPAGERLLALDFAARRELAAGAALGRFRVVHFATHAVIDAEHPELSGIALSMVDERGRPRDGWLRVPEIYSLRLRADLVVLSACETALGKDVRGEGVVGLARAFLHAGARQVLVSLWPVEDGATAELMRGFYGEIFRGGRPPAEALRRVQDDLRRRPGRQAPHYWAGFQLHGDWP